ncbi:MAG TPA: type III pantothenate kinase [Aggregatilineales bacterium]|nr:type III pantothenate kinase [Anaerolineales bacterium]HRE46775.1 type III pantothenate kinase [Aggregatilineales bacterium]
MPLPSTLLAIDIGNTNVTMGLWQDGTWRHDWRVRTVHNKMPDEYAALVRSFLRDSDLTFADIRRVVIASVVPPLTLAFTELSERYMHLEPLVVTVKIPLGIGVDVDSPEQVGADRLVNAAAAHILYGGSVIVIDFGTATTFDVLTEGRYIGGSIAPGIGIALDALVGKTSQLYKVTLEPPPSAIGRNTTHAIQSGLFLGYVDMIDGLTRRIRAAFPAGAGAKVVATGGLAALVSKYSTMIEIVAPQLTLDGLRIIAELNES